MNKALSILSLLLALSPIAALASTAKPLPPLPAPTRATPDAPASASFDFVAGGDNRSVAHGEPQPPSTSEIFKEIGLIRPPFVIWTGDDIEGYLDTPAEIDGEYKDFLNLAAQANTPIYGIAGNHEYGFEPKLIDEYAKIMGPTYGSFDYDGSHFIGLASTEVVNGKITAGKLDDDQIAWLKDDLAANQGATNIFVFFHHYMYGPPDPDVPNSSDTGLVDTDTRDALHKIFVQYHVRAVFNGHSHMFYHKQVDGVDYYIAGNAGAPLDAKAEDGGYLGYSLVHVNGAKVTVDNFTPWTLITRTISGNDGKSSKAEVAVDGYAFPDVNLRGVSIKMPAASGYTVTAFNAYKTGPKTIDAAVSKQVTNPDKSVTLFISLLLKAHRATYVTVTANK